MAQAELNIPALPRKTGGVAVTLQWLSRWPVVPGVIMGCMVIVAVFAPWISPHPPLQNSLRERNSPPVWYEKGSWDHILGTDTVGRDLLSRLIYGSRISLMVVAVALISGTVVGTALGLVAGYFGGVLDEVIMRIVDIWLGLPFILVALVAAVVIGPGLTTMMGLLALLAWAGFVRNVRAEVLSLKTRDYVALANVAGAPTSRILFRHILPGVINTVLVIASLRSGQLILAEAFLSFLGAGIPPPTATWGNMLTNAQTFFTKGPHLVVMPGLLIVITVLCLYIIGDGIRDAFDPQMPR